MSSEDDKAENAWDKFDKWAENTYLSVIEDDLNEHNLALAAYVIRYGDIVTTNMHPLVWEVLGVDLGFDCWVKELFEDNYDL